MVLKRTFLLSCLATFLVLNSAFDDTCPQGCSCFDNGASCLVLTAEIVDIFYCKKEWRFVSLTVTDRAYLGRLPFYLCSQVEELQITKGNLTGLYKGDLYELTNLQVLELKRCGLMALGDHGLSDVKQTLREVRITGNPSLSDLRPETLAGLSLEKLILKDNGLTKIDKWFDDVTLSRSLTQVDLAGNKLTAIQREAFLHLRFLKRLILGRNLIRSIEPTAFRGLGILELLDLSFNELTEFSFVELAELPSLVALNLAHNNITTFNLPSCIGLKSLDLTHNRLKIPPNVNWARCNSIKSLHLAGNGFTCIEEDYRSPSYVTLDLPLCSQDRAARNTFVSKSETPQITGKVWVIPLCVCLSIVVVGVIVAGVYCRIQRQNRLRAAGYAVGRSTDETVNV